MPKRKNFFGSRGDTDDDSDYAFSDEDFGSKSKKKEKSKKDKKDKKKKESSKKDKKSDNGTKKMKTSGDDSIIVLDDDSGPGDVYSIKPSPNEKSLKVTLERLSPECVNKLVIRNTESEKPKDTDAVSHGKKESIQHASIIYQEKERKSEKNDFDDENKYNDVNDSQDAPPKKVKEVELKPLQETPKAVKTSKPVESGETNDDGGTHSIKNELETSSKRNLRETKARKSHVKFNPLQYVEPVKTPPLAIKVGLSRHSRPKKPLHPLLARTSL